jgi:hypothetical protein
MAIKLHTKVTKYLPTKAVFRHNLITFLVNICKLCLVLKPNDNLLETSGRVRELSHF